VPVTSDTGELAVIAADRIFRGGLRSGGSTFEPGLPAWSATAVAELRRCFVEKPDQGGDDFLTKLQRQLSDAPDEAIVLAAELLYLNMLPLHERQIGRPAKRHILTKVLSWVKTGSPEVPPDLDDAMAGFINGGMAFLSLRWAQLQFLILLVGELLQADPTVENWAMAVPGLKVVVPATPADVVGLMAAAVRDPDPVIFPEAKALLPTKGDVPDGELVDELGKAVVRRRGEHATIAALGLMVPRARRCRATRGGGRHRVHRCRRALPGAAGHADAAGRDQRDRAAVHGRGEPAAVRLGRRARLDRD
jgi:Transketolase, pyrimidine binding domain